MKEAIAVLVTIAAGIILIFAIIGALFMNDTKPSSVSYGTCDRIVRHGDELVCEVIMQAEDDNIVVGRIVR